VTLGFGYFGEAWGVYGFWSGMAVGLALVSIMVGIRLYKTSGDIDRIQAFARI
jgi:Na+-driven multidrug efflux pump